MELSLLEVETAIKRRIKEQFERVMMLTNTSNNTS
jgi:hypothetical protein